MDIANFCKLDIRGKWNHPVYRWISNAYRWSHVREIISLGTKLINWGIHELHNRGYTMISLWVLKENISARKFYDKMGFIHDGTIKEINIGKTLKEYRYFNGIS